MSKFYLPPSIIHINYKKKYKNEIAINITFNIITSPKLKL